MEYKKIEEMKLGVFGLTEKQKENLAKIFGSVEEILFGRMYRYDALFVDITYAPNRMHQYIARHSHIPLIVQSAKEENYKKMEYLPHFSYMIWASGHAFEEKGFVKLFQDYLDYCKNRYDNLKIDFARVPGCVEAQEKKRKMQEQRLKEIKTQNKNDITVMTKQEMRDVFLGISSQKEQRPPIKIVEVKNPMCFSPKEERKQEIWKEWLVKHGKLDKSNLQSLNTVIID